jgi:LuxR family maltose regulon positive regulatory protein
VRVFVDEGAPMAGLLRAAAAGRPASAYVERLLDALGEPPRGGRRPARAGGLVEPLSERERDVLRLLATDLTGPEIARRLVVSLNTVRTHTKNIYAKLGVNSRRAAVRRAEELDL